MAAALNDTEVQLNAVTAAVAGAGVAAPPLLFEQEITAKTRYKAIKILKDVNFILSVFICANFF